MTRTANAADRDGLNHKQRLFVHEYMVDFNQSKAAERAGYTGRAIRNTASDLMANEHVKKAIARAMHERAQSCDVTAERVLLEYASLAFSDITHYMTWDEARGVVLRPSEELTKMQRSAIAEVRQESTEHGPQIRLKLHPKQPALDKLAEFVKLNEGAISVRVGNQEFLFSIKPKPEEGKLDQDLVTYEEPRPEEADDGEE
jgi:phage terminase small subunit